VRIGDAGEADAERGAPAVWMTPKVALLAMFVPGAPKFTILSALSASARRSK
jgi:hypothetical protein